MVNKSLKVISHGTVSARNILIITNDRTPKTNTTILLGSTMEKQRGK